MAASQGSQGSSPASGGDKKRNGGRAPQRPAPRRPVPTPAEVFPRGKRPPRRPEPAEPAPPQRGAGEGGAERDAQSGKPGGNGGGARNGGGAQGGQGGQGAGEGGDNPA